MKNTIFLTACVILAAFCVPQLRATHGHKKKPQPQEKKECDRSLRGQLEQRTRERDDARKQAHLLGERLRKAEGDLRNCQSKEAEITKQLKAMSDAIRVGVEKRRVIELELAKALQGHSAESDKVKRLESALREHVARQKQDEDALAKARYTIEQAKRELNASVRMRQDLEAKLAAANKRAEGAEDQVAELKKLLQEKDALQQRTKHALDVSEAALAKAVSDLQNAAAARKSLEESLKKEQGKSSAAKTEVEDLTRRLQGVSGQYEKAKDELAALQKRYKEATELLASREQSAKSANAEITRLKELVAQLSNTKSKLESDLAATRKSSDVARAAVSGLEGKLKELNTENGRLEESLKALRAQHEASSSTASRRVEEMRKAVEELQKKLHAAGGANRQLESALKVAKDGLAREQDESGKRLDAARKMIAEGEQRFKDLLAEKQKLTAALGAAQSDAQRAKSEVESMRREKESIANKLQVAEVALEDVSGDYLELKGKLRESSEAISALERKHASTLAELNGKKSALAEAMKKVAELEQRHVRDAREIKKLTEELAAARHNSHHADGKLKALMTEMGQIKATLHGVARFGEAHKELVKAHSELQEQCCAKKKELEKLRTDLRAALEKAAAAEGRSSDVNSQVTKLRTQLDRGEKAKHDLEARLRKTEIALRDAKKELDTVWAEMSKRAEELKVCKARKASLEKALAEAETARRSMASLNQELEAKLKAALNAKPDERVIRELQECRKRLAESEKKRLAAEAQITSLKVQIVSLRKEADAFREQLVRIEPVYYTINCAKVQQQQDRVLNQVKEVLEFYPKATFSLTGNTCNVGSDAANLKLSQERASGLRDFLTGKGIPANKITSKGLGEAKPIADNHTELGRRLNRRVAVGVDLHLD